MCSGDWTEVFYINELTTEAQRDALDAILSGHAGGPWELLAGFVSKRLPSRFVAIHFEDEGRTKRVAIPGFFDTTVAAIRGSDGVADAVLSNLHNVIHGAVHVLARGRTRC